MRSWKYESKFSVLSLKFCKKFRIYIAFQHALLGLCFSDFSQVRSLRSWSEFNWLQSCFYYIMIQIILTCCRKTQCQVEYIFAIVFHKEQAVLQNHPVIYYWFFKVIFNLFVTSKNETTNSPNHQFMNLKCCIQAREPFKTPF